MKKLIFLIIVFFSVVVHGQKPRVEISRDVPLTTAEMNAIVNPQEGWTIDNGETDTKWRYDGSLWINLGVPATDENDFLSSVTESAGVLTFNIPNQTNPTLALNGINLSAFNNDLNFIIWSSPVDDHVIPGTTGTYDFGTAVSRFRQFYGGSIDLTGSVVVGNHIDIGGSMLYTPIGGLASIAGKNEAGFLTGNRYSWKQLDAESELVHNFNGLTGDREVIWPDKPGTVALLDDITDSGLPQSNQIIPDAVNRTIFVGDSGILGVADKFGSPILTINSGGSVDVQNLNSGIPGTAIEIGGGVGLTVGNVPNTQTLPTGVRGQFLYDRNDNQFKFKNDTEWFAPFDDRLKFETITTENFTPTIIYANNLSTKKRPVKIRMESADTQFINAPSNPIVGMSYYFVQKGAGKTVVNVLDNITGELQETTKRGAVFTMEYTGDTTNGQSGWEISGGLTTYDPTTPLDLGNRILDIVAPTTGSVGDLIASVPNSGTGDAVAASQGDPLKQPTIQLDANGEKVIRFDSSVTGEEDYLDLGNPTDLNLPPGTSYDVFILVGTSSNTGALLSKRSGSSRDYHLAKNSATTLLTQIGSGQTFFTSSSFGTKPMLITYEVSATTYDVYLDDVLVIDDAAVGTGSSPTSNVLIGARYSSGTPDAFYSGDIIEIHLRTGLTRAEFAQVRSHIIR